MLSQLMEKYRNEFKGFYDEGKLDGRTEGKAEAILDILMGRGLAVPQEVRERVLRCQDPEQLRRWLLRAITVSTPEEIFLGA